MVKNLPNRVGVAGDTGLIPGLGKAPGGGRGNSPSIPAWEIPWTEKPDSYSPWGCKESGTTEHARQRS